MVVEFEFGGKGILQTGFQDDPLFSPADLAPFSHFDILHSGKAYVGQKPPRSISNWFLPLAQAILVSEQARLCDPK